MVDSAFVNTLSRWLFEHEVERDAKLVVQSVVDRAPDRFELDIAKL